MAFADLSSTTQDVLMIQFEFFGKMFLLAFFLIMAILVIHNHKKKEETPYFLIAFIRSILYSLSWVFLFFVPLFLLWLYPQLDISHIWSYVFWIYGYAIIIIGIVLLINIIYFGPMIIAKLGGLNVKSQKTNKIIDLWFGKYKKYFNRR